MGRKQLLNRSRRPATCEVEYAMPQGAKDTSHPQVRCPDPACACSNYASARFCARCGRALPRDDSLFDDYGESDVRSVGMAYLLWALCIVGVAGIHPFYAGRYITGVIWLLTWGLLGIGLLIDLFLIPGMVESKNRDMAGSESWQAP